MTLDRALGLDWMAYFNFIYTRHALLLATVLACGMIGWPVFGVPIVLGAARRYRCLQEFTLAFAIALVVTTAISAFTPAMGTYDFLHFMPDPRCSPPPLSAGTTAPARVPRYAVLLATPLGGGHYFVNVFAGIACNPSRYPMGKGR